MEKAVTVYIPTRNRSRLLLRAITSVLAQDGCEFEIIVVDDASTDETPQLLSEISKLPEITTIRLDRSFGAPHARNVAIRAARYPLVTGLDDDDFFLPGRLHRLIETSETHGGAPSASNDLIVTRSRIRQARKPSRARLADVKFTNMIGNQVLAPTSMYLEAGLFDEDLRAGQDYDMWLRILKIAGEIRIDPRPGQVVDASHSTGQISNSPGKAEGYARVRRRALDALGAKRGDYALAEAIQYGKYSLPAVAALIQEILTVDRHPHAKMALIKELIKHIGMRGA
jgi:glycosyltransferase involved in cell wall biosynthesis